MHTIQEREGVVGYTLNIPVSLHRKLTAASLAAKRSMKDIILSGTKAELEKLADNEPLVKTG